MNEELNKFKGLSTIDLTLIAEYYSQIVQYLSNPTSEAIIKSSQLSPEFRQFITNLLIDSGMNKAEKVKEDMETKVEGLQKEIEGLKNII